MLGKFKEKLKSVGRWIKRNVKTIIAVGITAGIGLVAVVIDHITAYNKGWDNGHDDTITSLGSLILSSMAKNGQKYVMSCINAYGDRAIGLKVEGDTDEYMKNENNKIVTKVIARVAMVSKDNDGRKPQHNTWYDRLLRNNNRNYMKRFNAPVCTNDKENA